MKALAALLALSSVLLAEAALACPPPPPPPRPPAPIAGETANAYNTRLSEFHAEQARLKALKDARWEGYREGYEQSLWHSAPQVVLAEITEIGSTDLRRDDGTIYGTSPEVTLRVLASAKGASSDRPFKLRYRGLTSCGPLGPVNVVQGQIGQRFVIFAGAGDLEMDTVVGGYGEADAITAQSQQLLARQPAIGRESE